MPKALLIDDEPTARAVLRAMLADHADVTVVGEAETIKEAHQALVQADYDLVFLDVQLLGGNGFDLVPLVRPEARIVFVTAFDRFAVRAFEVNALDYLVKPIAVERLAGCLRRLQPAGEASRDTPRATLNDVTYVKTGQGAGRFVRLAEILTIEGADNYTELNTLKGEHVLVRRTMAAWEEMLPPSHFMRVHRHTIVSLTHVNGFSHVDREITHLQVAGRSEALRARREHWPALRDRLVALHGNRFAME